MISAANVVHKSFIIFTIILEIRGLEAPTAKSSWREKRADNFPQRSPCREGWRIKYDRFEYECRNNAYEPISCFSKDDSSMTALNVEFEEDGFMVKCIQESSNVAKIEGIGCVDNGHLYQPGDKIPSATKPFFATCEKTPTGTLIKRPGGCIGDNGQMVADGQRVSHQKVVHTCSIKNGQSRLDPV